MRKSALIVSYYFAPQNAIGAVRPTKIAKYLQSLGWDITVICGIGYNMRIDPILEKDMQGIGRIVRIQEFNPINVLKKLKRNAEKQSNKQKYTVESGKVNENGKSLSHSIADIVYQFMVLLGDFSFSKKAIRILKKENKHYDVVWSSYAPFSVHRIGEYAMKNGMTERWIADFRDESDVPFPFMKGFLKRYMNMVKKEADNITVVSDGLLEKMNIGEKGFILPNGFDPEDITNINYQKDPNVFTAVYCGQIGSSRSDLPPRDLRPIFRAFSSVPSSILPKSKLRLAYCGPDAQLFEEYAEECGLAQCVVNFGTVTREQSLRLQLQSDALLLSSWYNKRNTGILTGKLFEYLMMNRPILCYVSGNMCGSGIKKIIDTCNCGICCEECAGIEGIDQLEDYVLELVKRWKNGDDLLPEREKRDIEMYTYKENAKKLEELMLKSAT